MDGPSKVSRLSPLKIGAALVVAGALSVGAAACGSGSSSDQSTSVANKESGFEKGTYLKVVNTFGSDQRSTAQPISVSICAVNEGCKDPQTLTKDQSVDMANSSESTQADVDGSIRFNDGNRLRFVAGNPNIANPWIEIRDPNDNTLISRYLPDQFSDTGQAMGGCTPKPCPREYAVKADAQGVNFWFRRVADSSDYVTLQLDVGGE
jgi:hypothetical protein